MVSVKKLWTQSIVLIFLLSIVVDSLGNVETNSVQNKTVIDTEEDRSAGTEKIVINYVDEDILDIINDLSAKKNVNVIVPTGANALKIKVNFKLPYKETLNKAWDLLTTYLDMAGYSLLPKDNMFIITKNTSIFDAKQARQPTRLFIDVDPSELPATDERITYLYYFSNLRINSESTKNINEIAQSVLPEQSFYKVNEETNSILLIAKSFDIKSFMELLVHFDDTEYKEQLEFIRLRHTEAEEIAKMFNEYILNIGRTPPKGIARYRADLKKPNEDAYFPESIKIIAYPEHNSLVVMGRAQAIDRVKSFIYQYIDVELESGRSVLHVYKLQYLDATEFAQTLEKIVESSRAGGTGQSVGGKKKGSTERFFDEVIIRVDKLPVQSSGDGIKYAGSNKLVIAARHDDWIRIKELIEKLDRPQPQVIIEVLIADLTLNDTRQLANQIRNPAGIPFPGSVTAQAAHLVRPIIDQGLDNMMPGHTTARSLAPDLIQQGVENIKNASSSEDVTAAELQAAIGATTGSTIMQMADDDGKTWDILKILNTFSYAKVLSHPHIVVTNNKSAKISNGETRLVDDQANPATTATVIKKKPITANLDVNITPRISSAQEVVLDIKIKINEFSAALSSEESPGDGDRDTRELNTKAYLKSGELLALGGLVKTNLRGGATATPLISKIPILGWLFKSRRDVEDQTTLSVFITPTIIYPKLRSGVDDYTRAYTDFAKDDAQEKDMFYSLKDPITRWFFKHDIETRAEVDEFLEHQEEKEVHPERSIEVSSVDDVAQKELITIDSRARKDTKHAIVEHKKDDMHSSVIAIPHAKVAMPQERAQAAQEQKERNVVAQDKHADNAVCHEQVVSRSEKLKALLGNMDSLEGASGAPAA